MPLFILASLRVRLVLLVLLALLPAFGLALYGDLEQRRLATNAAQDNALRLARIAASNQSRLIEIAHQRLIAIVQRPEIRQRDAAACNLLFANYLKQYSTYANLGAVDADGNVFCSGVPFQPPVNVADLRFFQAAVNSRDFTVGEYQSSRVSSVPLLDVALPVLDENGKPQGVVYASLGFDWINRLATEAQSPPGSAINVTDRNGTILARFPDPDKWVGKSAQAMFFGKALDQPPGEGTTEAIDLDGISRLYAFVPVIAAGQLPDVYVSVGIPSTVAFAEANQSLVRNLIGLGLVAALALAAAWFFGDVFIARRLSALSDVTEQLSAGNLSARTGQTYASSELGKLERRLDEMATSLQQREATLRKWADIFQSTQVGLTVSSPDGESLWLMNPAFAAMHGYSVDELVGRPLRDLVPPEDRLGIPQVLRAISEKGHHILEYKGVRKDGTVFPGLIDATAVKDENGETLYLIASAQDISQLRRAEAAEREQRALADALHDTASVLNSTHDFDEVLERILDSVWRVVQHDSANIMLIESDVARVVGSRGYAERGLETWLVAQRFPIAQHARLRQMVETGQPQLVSDTRDFPGWVDFPETHWIRSVIGMPIRVRDRVIGFLNLDSSTPGFFNAAHITRLETFADQVAIALENARLLAETEQRANQFTALYELAHDLATQRDLRTLLNSIVDRAIELFDAPCGYVYLYDAARQDLELAVEKGMNIPTGTRIQMGEGMAGRVVQSRQPLIVDDYSSWEHRSPKYEGVPYTACVEVPITYAGDLIGVLGVSEIGNQTRKFTESDAYLLTLFAGQAASMIRNARLLEETHTRAEQLAMLYDAGLTLNSVLDPRVQLEFLLKIATRALHAERAEFFRFDAARSQLQVELSVGYVEERARQAVHQLCFSIEDERGLVGSIARRLTPLNLGDVQADSRWIVIDPEIRSGLWVPVQHENQLLGILAVLSTRLNAFTAQDERLLILFANQVATAMENARLFETQRRRSAELEALRQASLHVTSTLDLPQVLEQIIEHALKLVSANNAHIFLYDGACLTFGAAMWADARQRKPYSEPRENGVTYHVARSGIRIVVPDVSKHPLFEDRPWPGAIVSLPLKVGARVRGVMNVAFSQPHAFDEDELRVLELLADQATVALENARLMDETRRRAERLAVLYRIASAVHQTLNLDELVEVIYEQVTATFKSDAFFIALYDAAKNELDYRIQIDQGVREPRRRRAVTTGFGAHVIKTQKPLLIRNWETEKEHLPQPVLWGTMKPPISWLGVPMRIGDAVVGLIGVESYEPEAYGEEEEHLLATIADQVAMVIQNARLFDETRRRAERLAMLNRIGRAVSQTLELNELLEVIYREITAVIPVEAFFIAFYDAAAKELDYRVRVDEGVREPPIRLPLRTGLGERVIVSKKPLLIRDREREEQIAPAPQTLWGSMKPAVSWLGVPMLKSDAVVGIISVQSYSPDAYGEEEERLLATIADQVSVAVQNARLFDETRQRLVELEAVNKVSTALRVAQTIDEMMPLLLDETLAALGASAGQIALYDAPMDEMRVVAARGWFDGTPRIAKATDGIAGLVFETGQPYVTREFKPDTNTSELARAQIPEGWGGTIVPIRAAQEIIGVVEVSVRLPRLIQPSEVHLLTTLAEIAGNAIHRATLHEQTEQRLQRLDALHVIDTAIGASLDLRVTLNVLLDQVLTQLRADAADILILNPHTQMLEFAAARGFRTNRIQHARVRMGQDYAGHAAIERRPSFIPNLGAAGASKSPELFTDEGFVAYYAASLIAKGQIKGVLEVFQRSSIKPDAEWLDFAETLAGQAAIAIDNAGLFDGLQRSNFDMSLAYDATIEGWARSLDLHDQEPRGHASHVMQMTLRLARAMGMGDAELAHVRRGALLHDIGKMGIPDSILLKGEPLTEEEEKIVRRHPTLAYELLSSIAYLRPAMDIPYCHHENWDGTGYPRGLKGDQIPLAARIFAVADAWVRWRTDGASGAALTDEQARQHLLERSGAYFDPRVVQVFLRMIERDGA